jgi:hypothetical protein
VAYHLAMTSDLDQDSFYTFGGWTAHEGGGGGPNIPAIANHYRRMRAG